MTQDDEEEVDVGLKMTSIFEYDFWEKFDFISELSRWSNCY